MKLSRIILIALVIYLVLSLFNGCNYLNDQYYLSNLDSEDTTVVLNAIDYFGNLNNDEYLNEISDAYKIQSNIKIKNELLELSVRLAAYNIKERKNNIILYDRKEYINPILLPLIDDAINSKDRLLNFTAIHKIGSLNLNQYEETLFPFLNNNDFTIRATTAETLGKIGSDKSISYLIQTVDSDSVYFVVHQAINSLGNIGNSETAEYLKNKTSFLGDSHKREIDLAIEKINNRMAKYQGV